MSLRPNSYRAVVGARLSIEPVGYIGGRPGRAGPARQCGVLPPEAKPRMAALAGRIAALPRHALPWLDTIEAALAYPYVRYTVLPWQEAILAPAERNAYAAAMLVEEYGLTAADWECSALPQRFGATGLACAVRCDIAADLRAIAQKHRLRLRGIYPLLIDAVARHRGTLPNDAVFMMRQPDACEFVFRRQAQWRCAMTLRSAGQSAAQTLLSAALLAQQFPAALYLEDCLGANAEDERAGT